MRAHTRGAGSGGKGPAWSHSEKTGGSSGPLCLSVSTCKRRLIVLFDRFQGALGLCSRILSPNSQHGEPWPRERQPGPEEGPLNRRVCVRGRRSLLTRLSRDSPTEEGCAPSTTPEFTGELAQNHEKEPVGGWRSWQCLTRKLSPDTERGSGLGCVVPWAPSTASASSDFCWMCRTFSGTRAACRKVRSREPPIQESIQAKSGHPLVQLVGMN